MEALITRIKERVADPTRAVDAATWVRPAPTVAPPATPAELDAANDALGFRVGVPSEFPGANTKQWANNWFRMIAYDYGLGFDESRSFERRFVQPWLIRGRFPCGWKGKPQRKPDLNDIASPWHGVTVEDLAGDGQLIVF